MNNAPVIWRRHKELHKHLGKKGKVITWTKIFVAPEGFESEVPYVCAIIEFADKSRVTVQVVDVSDSEIKEGQKVEVVLRRIGKAAPDGLIQYGVKVRPV